MNIKNIKPVGERCSVELIQAATQSTSGLVLEHSSNASIAPAIGKIVSVGDKSQFKIGDVIFFRRYSLDELKYITKDGEQSVFFVDDEEIIGLAEVEL